MSRRKLPIKDRQIVWHGPEPSAGEPRVNGHVLSTEWPQTSTQPASASADRQLPAQSPLSKTPGEAHSVNGWVILGRIVVGLRQALGFVGRSIVALILLGLAGTIIAASLSGSVLYGQMVSLGGANTTTVSTPLVVAEIVCVFVMPLTMHFWRTGQRWSVFWCVFILAICIPIGFLSQNGFFSRSMSGGVEKKTEQKTEESPEVRDARKAVTTADGAVADAETTIATRTAAETRECSKPFNDRNCAQRTKERVAAEADLKQAREKQEGAQKALSEPRAKAKEQAKIVTDPSDDWLGKQISPRQQRAIQTYLIILFQILGPGLLSTLALGLMSGPVSRRQ